MADKKQLKKWFPTQKIEYIDGKQKLGIKIDWKLVRKEYHKLHCPADSHNPLMADFDKCGYVLDLSDRSRGKTTNKLLVGLILFKLYGIVLHYIRQRKDECEYKMLCDLYETVKDYNYIKKIFDDEYNDIEYVGKRWYLIKRTVSGDIAYSCEDNCTFCIGLDENDKLKSTYNAPRGDMIFHDEFITSVYGWNDFIRFTDICKTIIRDRLSPVIFMSSNNINKNSQWFDELCIRTDIESMEMGDKKYIETNLGTHLYIDFLSENVSPVREKVNMRFWGFPNPRLASITGKGSWATESFQHIPTYQEEDEQPRELQNVVFISMSGKLVKLRLVKDYALGLCVYVTPATKTYDDSVILTADDITSKRHLFGLGKGTFLEAYWKLYDQNKFYYARNSEGAFVKSYISYYRTKSRSMKG